MLATALIVPTLTGAGVQTGTADPASAVRKQFRAGHGVKISERYTVTADGKPILSERLKGVVQFGTSGVVASDVTIEKLICLDPAETVEKWISFDNQVRGEVLEKPERRIRVRGTPYSTGGTIGATAPADRPWVRLSPESPLLSPSNQHDITIFEPKTLRRLLSTATRKGPGGTVDGARTTHYQGTITRAELYRISPSFRAESFGTPPRGALAKATVNWRIWIDGKGLPRRLLTWHSIKAANETQHHRVDTRYSEWGTRVTVKAPPADRVIDIRDLQRRQPAIDLKPAN